MGDPESETVRLIVFAKLPISGEVKTRLGEAVGMETAAALYRTWVPPFLETLLSITGRVSIEVCMARPRGGNYADEEVLAQSRGWLPYPVDFALQAGENLGARLPKAFERATESGWRKILILGSDSPQLTKDEIAANLDLLAQYDLSLGPAEDGGFYSIGLSRPPGDLLRLIRWSSPHTLSDTRKAAIERGMTIGTGPLLYDIDTLEDLQRLILTDPERWFPLASLLE